jgi:hypothetical protein
LGLGDLPPSIDLPLKGEGLYWGSTYSPQGFVSAVTTAMCQILGRVCKGEMTSLGEARSK